MFSKAYKLASSVHNDKNALLPALIAGLTVILMLELVNVVAHPLFSII